MIVTLLIIIIMKIQTATAPNCTTLKLSVPKLDLMASPKKIVDLDHYKTPRIVCTLTQSEYCSKSHTVWKTFKFTEKNNNPIPLHLAIDKKSNTTDKLLCGACRHDEPEDESIQITEKAITSTYFFNNTKLLLYTDGGSHIPLKTAYD